MTPLHLSSPRTECGEWFVVSHGDRDEHDALLWTLDQLVQAVEDARRQFDAARVRRDAAIAKVHQEKQLGYRRLAERTGLSVARIQQIIGIAPARPTMGRVAQACPTCGNEAYAIGNNERFCPKCGWNASGE